MTDLAGWALIALVFAAALTASAVFNRKGSDEVPAPDVPKAGNGADQRTV